MPPAPAERGPRVGSHRRREPEAQQRPGPALPLPSATSSSIAPFTWEKHHWKSLLPPPPPPPATPEEGREGGEGREGRPAAPSAPAAPGPAPSPAGPGPGRARPHRLGRTPRPGPAPRGRPRCPQCPPSPHRRGAASRHPGPRCAVRCGRACRAGSRGALRPAGEAEPERSRSAAGRRSLTCHVARCRWGGEKAPAGSGSQPPPPHGAAAAGGFGVSKWRPLPVGLIR